MANKENYEISDINVSLIWDIKKLEYKTIYKKMIRHKYLNNTYKEIKVFSSLELDEEINRYINYYDKKYADKYNFDLKKIWSSIYLSKIKKIDWKDLTNKEKFIWNRKSEFIEYDDTGKPTNYFRLNDTKRYRKKPILSLLMEKEICIENKERYEEYKKQEKNWLTDYSKEVKRIKTNYYNAQSNYIELYCKMILNFSIEFKKEIEEILKNRNFNLSFNKENKSLEIEFILPSKNDTQYLLGDMIYHSDKDKYLKTWIHEKEIIKRLDSIWKQLIFIYSYALFINDEIKAIDTIYFSAKLFDENQYKFELIIEKESFYKKKDSTKINCKNIDDCIDGFRRDTVLLKRLRLEKLDPQIRKDSKNNIISLAIRKQKLSNKSIEYISSFKYLKELYLSENNLKQIPKNILELTQLEVLSITDNEIDHIPDVDDLNRIDTLNLDNNLIEYIDEKLLKQLLEMPILKDISLNGNPIIDLIDEDISYLEKDELISKLLAMPNKITFKQVKNKNIPLIITEGKTDWMHLEKALLRFQEEGKYLNLVPDVDIEFKKFKEVSMSDSELDAFAQSYSKEKNSRKIICIFDRDLPSRVEAYGKHDFIQVGNKQYINTLKNKCQRKYGKTSPKYLELEQKLDDSQFKQIDEKIRKDLTGDEQEEWETLLHNNVYAFCIPKLNDELDEICMEFYYKDKDLKKEDDEGKRLFIADEFEFQENVNNCNRFISKCGQYKTDTQSGNSNNKKITLQYPNKKERGYVYKIDEKECNKSNTMNLSKNKFAKNIYYDVEGFDDFNIENFRLIFDVIEKIIND